MEATNHTNSAFSNFAKITFSWYDYTLFSAMLILSALIGVYFGCFGKKQTTADEYLLGGKTMKVLPIAMSLVASQVSGLALLSVPADVYIFGATYWLTCPAISLTCLITNYVYLPVFYKLQLTSTYEYLKLRFDTRVRLYASFLFALSVLLYLPIVIYVPALALSQATDINIHMITPIVCGVCVFYTTIGGLKAVVWTDMLQFTVTIGAMGAVFYLGIVSAGGFAAIYDISKAGHRLDIDYDINPTKRDTFWAMMLGWTVTSVAAVSVGQSCVQKFMAVPTMKDAKMSVLLFLIGMLIVKTACVMTGLIIYSKYYDCDPLTTGVINKPDQLLPYYVMEVAGKIPGLPGLFIAGIFCAALSTLSAIMNCLAGTLYEDFVSRFVPTDITQKNISNVLKIIVIVIGVISTSFVFLVQHLGGLLPVAIGFASVTSGPLLGLFTLGMLFPRANAKGAFYGGMASLVFISWIAIGAQWYQLKKLTKYEPKPVSIDGCAYDVPMLNKTLTQEPREIFFMYRITYYYYALFSAVVVVIVGLIVSYATKKDEKEVHRDLLSPVIYRFLKEDKSDTYDYDTIPQALHIISSKEETDDKIL